MCVFYKTLESKTAKYVITYQIKLHISLLCAGLKPFEVNILRTIKTVNDAHEHTDTDVAQDLDFNNRVEIHTKTTT